ncbi:MAG: glycoside hydrolase family 2 TIM barrel-domain containing protein [Segetibacter sp.]
MKGCNFSTHYPVGYTVPLYEDMLRRDVVNMKALDFNFVRIPFGCPNPEVLEIYDEMGIMVHQEHYGSRQMAEYGGYKPSNNKNEKEALLNRFQNSIEGVVKRDRNHPSVVMWGVLNETHDGIVFRKAVDLLPSLRLLDPSRIIVLNSGRFDGAKEIGSISNPGSKKWDVSENELKDWHPYVWIPFNPNTLNDLTGATHTSNQRIYISEVGSLFPN